MELQLRLFVKRLCYTEHEQLKQAKPICEIIISGDDILIATVVTFYVFQIFRLKKKEKKGDTLIHIIKRGTKKRK